MFVWMADIVHLMVDMVKYHTGKQKHSEFVTRKIRLMFMFKKEIVVLS